MKNDVLVVLVAMAFCVVAFFGIAAAGKYIDNHLNFHKGNINESNY